MIALGQQRDRALGREALERDAAVRALHAHLGDQRDLTVVALLAARFPTTAVAATIGDDREPRAQRPPVIRPTA